MKKRKDTSVSNGELRICPNCGNKLRSKQKFAYFRGKVCCPECYYKLKYKTTGKIKEIEMFKELKAKGYA